MKNNTSMTYVERSRSLDTKAHRELLKGIARDWAAASTAAKTAGQQTVIGINRMRACGEKIKLLCGHDQISLDFYTSVATLLPKEMRFEAAKRAVHISNKLADDVHTPQEALAAQRDLFTATMECAEPRRLTDQVAHESNPWSELISKANGFTVFFGQLEEDEPMEKWSDEKLRSFVTNTKPIATAYQAAEALLK